MTSLFSTSFMCRLCGREVCNECFQQVRDLTQAPPNATPAELKAFNMKREKHAHANPFFLSCLKRNEHSMADFTPVTRFVGAELDKTIQEMEEILDKDATASQTTPPMNVAGSIIPSDTNHVHPQPVPPPIGAQPPQPQPALLTRPEPPAISTGIAYSAYRASSADVFPDPIASPVYDDYIPSNAPQHVTSIPTYPIQVIPANLYDAPKVSTSTTAPSPAFASLWRLGLPLLVKGGFDRFKIRWNPQYFIERYGDQSCLIIECQTEVNRRVRVAEFFEQFGQYKDRTESWKMKVGSPFRFYFVNDYTILI
jgi:lysine-specific demethylase 3